MTIKHAYSLNDDFFPAISLKLKLLVSEQIDEQDQNKHSTLNDIRIGSFKNLNYHFIRNYSFRTGKKRRIFLFIQACFKQKTTRCWYENE